MKLLRDLPKIDKLLAQEEFANLNKKILKKLAQSHIESLRKAIKEDKLTKLDAKNITQEVLKLYRHKTASSLKPLINATGVVIHTNLGRSPLSEEMFERAKQIACGYSNLEFDMQKGKRGERYEHISKQLCTLLGVEDALVVNNNAAAVFLVLNTFAKGKNTIVSRGELVEIGGSFRIPEVMKESGTKLKEVGTTNKTKLKDYENAIGKKTAVLMKVHRSNFSMQGFCESPSYEELINLAKKKGVLDYLDIGGAYIDTLPNTLKDEELNLSSILSLKPSLISFSGDKLLGSVQCGIILGQQSLINALKKNQLLRMLRVDKVTLSLLEATMEAYISEKKELIPTLKLLRRSESELKSMSENISKKLPKDKCEVVKTSSYVGGGTMPDKLLNSYGLHIKGGAVKLQEFFRKQGIIGRIHQERFILDLRSVLDPDELAQKLKNLL